MFFLRLFCTGLCFGLVFPVWTSVLAKPPTATKKEVVVSKTTSTPDDRASLKAFIELIWADSPAVLERQAQFEAAQARADGADKPLHNPVLALDTEQTDINTSFVDYSQTLDWSNKRGARTQVATQQVKTALADLMQSRQLTAIEALNALSLYYTARDMRKLTLRGSELMKGFKDTMDQRQTAGDVRALDITLAQLAYSEALMRLAASESAMAEAKAAVQAVSDINDAQWPPLPNKLAAPPKYTDEKLLDALPELVVLRSRLAAAKARINIAKSERRIDPTFALRAGREDTENLFGLSVEFPLFIRNNFSAEVVATSQDAIAMEQSYRNAYRRAKARMSGALGRFQNTHQAWRTWVAGGQQAYRKQHDLLQQMWQAGELSATDFLIQAKQNIDTQSAATALQSEFWQAKIAWLAASGQVETWLGLENLGNETNSGESK
ncbi:MAG: TolC family protein [Thiohalomonadales bacterium]